MSQLFTTLGELRGGYGHIYLAPHIDDAALSCGGTIARMIGAGERVLVLTICAGSPPDHAPLSEFAAAMHARWGLGPRDAVARRIAEELVALETLGADGLRLGLLDAIYRMPERYSSDRTLFGPVDPADPLAGDLSDILGQLAARYPEAIFYAPLGVGLHVDHQIVHLAAARLAAEGRAVAYYEDFPYVRAPGALGRRLAELGGEGLFTPAVSAIDGSLSRKIGAIEAYASQIGVLFGDATSMAHAVRDYAEELRPGDGTYGERVWVRR